jgi:hypothetical protein
MMNDELKAEARSQNEDGQSRFSFWLLASGF